MSGIALIARFIFATVAILVIGTIAVFSFQFIEPIQATLTLEQSLGWGDPMGTAVRFAVVGFLGLMLVLTIWLITAPVRNDRRQQTRRF